MHFVLNFFFPSKHSIHFILIANIINSYLHSAIDLWNSRVDDDVSAGLSKREFSILRHDLDGRSQNGLSDSLVALQFDVLVCVFFAWKYYWNIQEI